ncbi:hypothetical protein HYC85_025857 [Camellia sinensis]|uniref:Uncharacterized protein n=1 Tax=Camellia sinensis TaxID=4442 RepID=A0A7J7G542_CAMSI|nr:hypothetical protein HYC85_025857 [Camellia sinensis]
MSCLVLFFCRGTYRPAEQYLTYAEKSKVNLLENFKSMHVDYEEAQLENEGSDHQELLENGEDGGEEEPVEVDTDSTNGTVLVNGHEGEEEDGTNTDETQFWKSNLKWRFCRSFRRRFQWRFYGGDFVGDFSGIDEKDCYDRVDFVGDFSGVTVC